MKTIKVIDLINLIANEEEIPMRIKIRGNTFEWKVTENGTGYYNVEKYKGYDWLENYISLDNCDDLNTAVEIIEEDKPIKKFELEEIDNKVKYKSDTGEYTVRVIDIDMMAKINEIIDVINEIKENKEEK